MRRDDRARAYGRGIDHGCGQVIVDRLGEARRRAWIPGAGNGRRSDVAHF
jgi:hypothetical protein